MDARATRAEINISSLHHNLSEINAYAPSSQLCLVLKANAYGHGLTNIARLTQDRVSSFAVATINEGVKLRDSGITLPIFILSPHLREEIPTLVHYTLSPFVSHGEYLDSYKQEAKKMGKLLTLHLKIDTGMCRIGVRPENALSLAQDIVSSPFLSLEGLCTHYANADSSDTLESVHQQLSLFNDIKHLLTQHGIRPPMIHTANTGATLLHPETHFNMIRVGLGVYGYFEAKKNNLKPILSLKSKIMFAKTIQKDEKVSYGHTWTAKKTTQIGIIPAGYADGYTRLLSNKGNVLIDGKFYPIIGRVCMDQLIVDITGLSSPLEKDVLLYGNHDKLNASSLAHQAGLCVYEVLTTLAERVPRFYL